MAEPEKKSCEHTASCAMYALFKHSGTLAVWQINYCSGDYKRCARYMLSVEGKPVPLDLMPNGARLGGGR